VQGEGDVMEMVRSQRTVAGKAVRVVEGDLTEQKVDAIVNAANTHLQHGGGVAGVIVRKGGSVIQEESDRIGFTPVGQASITSAGRLKARFVIHAVGPRWGEGEEDEKLASAVCSSLDLASEKGLQTVAFPAISAGIFGFPKERCAQVITRALVSWLKEHPDSSLQRVDICLLGGPLVKHFVEAFSEEAAE